jgi:hypothetical protein
VPPAKARAWIGTIIVDLAVMVSTTMTLSKEVVHLVRASSKIPRVEPTLAIRPQASALVNSLILTKTKRLTWGEPVINAKQTVTR